MQLDFNIKTTSSDLHLRHEKKPQIHVILLNYRQRAYAQVGSKSECTKCSPHPNANSNYCHYLTVPDVWFMLLLTGL